jgi:hypothetical protein
VREYLTLQTHVSMKAFYLISEEFHILVNDSAKGALYLEEEITHCIFKVLNSGIYYCVWELKLKVGVV